MVYENAQIEVILADEDISMDLIISEKGDAGDDGSLDFGGGWG